MRLLVDAGVGYKDRWISSFRVATSVDGNSWPLRLEVKNHHWESNNTGCSWAEFYLPNGPVQAKYVKLLVDKPSNGWRQIAEFEVWEVLQVPNPVNCSIEATGPHMADGNDAAIITLTLKDSNGDPVTGYDERDIVFDLWNGCKSSNSFGEIAEIEPGVYQTTLTSTKEGVKKVVAAAHGAVIGFNPYHGWRCPIEFIGGQYEYTMAFIQGSKSHPQESWENAVDGDLDGWDGTATVKGDPCYAIFGFNGGGTFPVNKFFIVTDNGTDDDDPKLSGRRARKVCVEVSTSGTDNADFTKVLEKRIKKPMGQTFFLETPVQARYVKLTILKPNKSANQWRQIVEFEVHVDVDNGGYLAKKSFDVLSLPDKFAINQNYPNPFNPTTKIDFSLPMDAHVTVTIYNTIGQQVATLVDEHRMAGYHTAQWNATDVPSGLYFYRIEAGTFSKSARMLLMK